MPSLKKIQKIPKKAKPTRGKLKNYILYGILAVILSLVAISMLVPQSQATPASLTQVLSDIKDNKVDKVEIAGDRVTAAYKDNHKVTTHKEPTASFSDLLKNNNIDQNAVNVTIKDQSTSQLWVSLLGGLLPIFIVFIILFFVMRQAREAGQGIFSFGQSRAKLYTKDSPKVTFADVAGVDEAKQELEEVVDFLKHPEKYHALGARTPKGVLLVGPAGTGKTLLARAVAGEAGTPFYSVAGSEFMEMLVGVGASRVRDLFAQAKKSAPSLIFIDEIESIGRMRGFGFSGGHDEREQTLNQILVEMDGFNPNEAVIVVGATNRPDLLDPALVRPGRFDRRVVLDMPDIEGRKNIIKIHMKGKPFSSDVAIDRIAQRTVGFSGADLQNMLNEAAILAARHGKKQIDPVDLEEAATKVKLGPQRRRIITDDERKITAYHEAGHAIVNCFTLNTDPVHRISIVARGMSGGHTLMPPEVDRYNETKSRLIGRIATALGGRAAEEFIFTDYTTGAASDLEIASTIAREMVVTYGMSNLGPMAIQPQREFGMWQTQGETKVSEQMGSKIDMEVARIIDEGFQEAKRILKAHRKELDAVAKELLVKETLDRDEFEKIVGAKSKAEKEPKKNSRIRTTPALS